jgi:hypothetical protein
MCPRHSFLVKELGAREAERQEYGTKCSQCEKRFFGDDIGDCEDCDMCNVCVRCQAAGACCRAMLKEAEEDEQEASSRADHIRILLGRKAS